MSESNIAEVQGENSRVNQTTAVNTQDGAYVETFPTTQQQGPQIYDTPAGQIEGPLINVFPWVQPEPQVHVTPKTSIKSEPITGVPADAAKELGDNISWAKSKGKTQSTEETEYKKSKSGTGKEKATDVPSWAKGNRPKVGENGKEFADRLCNDRYGNGNYDKGPRSDFNKIRKWGDRAFE